MYKYPFWFNRKIYIYAIIVGVLFHSLPFVFGKAGNVEVGAVLAMTIFWIGAVVIYLLANRSESSSVSLTVKGIVVQKHLILWSEVESIENTADGSEGILLLIPSIGRKLGNCLKITTKNEDEFFIYTALEGYRDCVKRIEERLS